MSGEIDHGEGKMPENQLLSLLGRCTDRQAVGKGAHTLYHAAVFRGEEGSTSTHLGLLNILNRCIVALGVVRVQMWPLVPGALSSPRSQGTEARKPSATPF